MVPGDSPAAGEGEKEGEGEGAGAGEGVTEASREVFVEVDTEKTEDASSGNSYMNNFYALSSSVIKRAQTTSAVQFLQVHHLPTD